jgi:glycopeptide antibiotics resistance protein
MRTFVADVPLSLVALTCAAIIALFLSPAVAIRLGTGRWVALLLLLAIGLVVSATLMPTSSALAGVASDGRCSFGRAMLPSFARLTSVNVTSLNVLLFVPLGLSIALLPRTRAAVVVAAGAIASPFVVEAVQLSVPALGRNCVLADIVNNLLGLVVGFGLGSVARALYGQSGQRR